MIHLKLTKYLFILSLLFASCKPTSVIITSKKEAETKGMYTVPTTKKTTKKKEILAVQKKNEIAEKTKISKTNEVDFVLESTNSSYLVERLITSASVKIGTRYRSGGTTDEGFDCSGLMYTIFNLYDIKLPRSSFEQSKIGTVITKENIRKGDLIFFKTNGRGQVNHVGLVVEISEEEIKFIHSSTSSGVVISSTKEPYYQKSFVQVNRVLE